MPKSLKVFLPLGGLAILGVAVFNLLPTSPDDDGPRGGITPQIAAGDGHAMFLAADGQLYGWVEMILGRWVMALGVGALGGQGKRTLLQSNRPIRCG